ncbi:hypothetical protein M441DRAFT_377892 [Trichoderma asperellum CBS 433.97]|uniref:Uncharacterized protein n=1 Tax=Trichoderma asperellum (strain ATCC 204424 / CBS 433.97 / NBRC 101777) TaxID=1042311 RepID=A0A2T3ZG12_TRIA4|nr:hypothetical protein M441DRAFT_377892 [Trichoderma asperellum CBS 433.97]PTB43719.1 hypothetical protein M441DRAFT_377892 [Trichoderma asperellum CBS 433.97]
MLIAIFLLHNIIAISLEFTHTIILLLFLFPISFTLLSQPPFPLGSTTVAQFYVSLYRCFTHRLTVDVKKRANR